MGCGSSSVAPVTEGKIKFALNLSNTVRSKIHDLTGDLNLVTMFTKIKDLGTFFVADINITLNHFFFQHIIFTRSN